jgi:probable F420-dependent oxidoreductase
MELGRIGVWRSYASIGEGNERGTAQQAEGLGFGALWLGGAPQLLELRPFLEATERIVVVTGILNVWQSEPAQVSRDFAELDASFPGRLLLGLGIGHKEATALYTYEKPLETMRRFLDGLDSASTPVPRERRCLAALHPKMRELSRTRSLGTHSYFVPPEHTRITREEFGPGPLLAPELTVVLDPDVESGRAKARAFASRYLGLRSYAGNLLELGYTEDDVRGEGSDRLVDAVVAHGSAADIASAAQAHLHAGADHVCLQAVATPGDPDSAWPMLAEVTGALAT